MYVLLAIFGLIVSFAVLGALGLALLHIYESANAPEARLPAPRPAILAFVLTFAGALASALLCALLRLLNPLFRMPNAMAGASDGKAPVIFVHGLYDKASAWLYLARKCAGQGRLVRCFGYASRGATPQSVTSAFAQFMRGPDADFAGVKPILAGHSLGGLIIRNWLRDPANRERIAGVVTLGTPHGGSKCAHLAPGMLAASITPGAAFIRELAEAGTLADQARPALPRTSLASPTDGAVLPAAALLPPPGWNFRPTKASGHYTMLFSPAVWRMFCEELANIDQAALSNSHQART